MMLPDMPVTYGEALRKLIRVSRASGTMTGDQFTTCLIGLRKEFK